MKMIEQGKTYQKGSLFLNGTEEDFVGMWLILSVDIDGECYNQLHVGRGGCINLVRNGIDGFGQSIGSDDRLLFECDDEEFLCGNTNKKG